MYGSEPGTYNGTRGATERTESSLPYRFARSMATSRARSELGDPSTATVTRANIDRTSRRGDKGVSLPQPAFSEGLRPGPPPFPPREASCGPGLFQLQRHGFRLGERAEDRDDGGVAVAPGPGRGTARDPHLPDLRPRGPVPPGHLDPPPASQLAAGRVRSHRRQVLGPEAFAPGPRPRSDRPPRAPPPPPPRGGPPPRAPPPPPPPPPAAPPPAPPPPPPP